LSRLTALAGWAIARGNTTALTGKGYALFEKPQPLLGLGLTPRGKD